MHVVQALNSVSQQALATIRKVLQTYADRGVFRAFSETKTRNGSTAFRVLWLPITSEPFTLAYNNKQHALIFKNLLTGMPAKSEQYSELKSYLVERCSQHIREHRRIDSRRVEVQCSNRLGNVSLKLIIKKNNFEYGVRRALNLVNDLFLDHLNESTYYDYMAEHFDMPED